MIDNSQKKLHSGDGLAKWLQVEHRQIVDENFATSRVGIQIIETNQHQTWYVSNSFMDMFYSIGRETLIIIKNWFISK